MTPDQYVQEKFILCYLVPFDHNPVPADVMRGERLYIAFVNRMNERAPGVAAMWGQCCPECHTFNCVPMRGWPFCEN